MEFSQPEWDTGISLPGAFKPDHLQPLEILFILKKTPKTTGDLDPATNYSDEQFVAGPAISNPATINNRLLSSLLPFPVPTPSSQPVQISLSMSCQHNHIKAAYQVESVSWTSYPPNSSIGGKGASNRSQSPASWTTYSKIVHTTQGKKVDQWRRSTRPFLSPYAVTYF